MMVERNMLVKRLSKFIVVTTASVVATMLLVMQAGAFSDSTTEYTSESGDVVENVTDTVATPVFTPADGTVFKNVQQVVIACDTEEAKIYYTIDDTNPTKESILYEGPFTIKQSTVVKAFAVCDGYADSEVTTAKFIRKSTGGGSGGGYSGGVVVVKEPPVLNDVKMPWTDMKSAISKLDIGTQATIELNENYDVPTYIIMAIKERELKITFVIDDARSWYVNGTDIDKVVPADLRVIEMASHRVHGLNGTVVKVYGTEGANIPARLTVKLGAENAGKYAFVYRVTEDGYALSERVQLDAEGNANGLDLTEIGKYVIMLRESAVLKGDVNNDGIVDQLDAQTVLKNIVYEVKSDIDVADFDENSSVNVLDASAILIALKNGEV